MPEIKTNDFNSAEYAWKDIEVSFMGRVLVRILEITYSEDSEVKHIYGRGRNPVGVQNGNTKPGGSLTIGQSELEAFTRDIQSVIPGGKITDVSFDVNIAYLGTEAVVRDRVVGARVTKYEKGMKQGDTDMQIKLPYLCLRIDHNV